ncbi:MAG TPA: hypothetical protein VFH88_14140, partial [Candidatus Krumholzibacteria bacterium]|nr:hypothetical protein [Candidatus Krumholzibacteria bacterium]
MVDAKSVRTKRVRNLVAALLIVITAFGAYFFLYTQRRERQVTAHNLRLLATTADYMGDALLGCAGSIRLALMEAETPDSAAIAKKLELIKGLARRSGGDLTTTQLDSLTKAEVVPRLEFKNLQWGVDGQIAIALEGYNGESQLVFMPARTRPGNLSAGAWRLLLRDVVEPIAPLDVFDEVVLARADGDVLLEAGRGSLRVENLVLNAQRSKDDQSAPEGGVGSRVWDADFGDQTQRLYLQPVRLPIPINVAMTGGKLAPEDHWVVVGIMPKARARSLSMSIPPNAILGTVAILALGLLLLPLIKIRFMGAREELRQVDVVAMLVATVLTVSVATHCILFACAQHWEACRVDGELNNLAMQINWQLRRELRGLNNELARQTRGVRPEGLKQNILADSTVTASDPFFEQVFFMNSRGWQKAKWTTHKSNTPVSNLAERRYFDEAYHGRLWQFLEEDTTDARPRRGAGFEKDEPDTMFTPGCYVESIRSRTTGRETAILSRRYHELQKPDSVIVAAIESRLRSVMNPVLPLGYGFAIMDESGAVQFHSDPTRNVRENFFEELDPALPLQRAVRAREKAFTRATYRTVQSVVYVRPITSTPWVLAVFYDWHSTELWLLEVSVYSLSLFIAVLLVGALLTIVTHLGLVRLSKRNRRRPGEAHAVWFWIRDAHRARYRRVLVASVSFIVVWALLCRHATGKAFIIVSMLLPALAYASLFLTLREPSTESATVPPPLERRPSRSTIRYYGAMIFALIIIGGSLPAAYSFRVIQREETVMAMQDRQLALMKSVAARRTALVKAYANVALSDTARTALISELEPRVVADRDGSSMTGEDSARDADSLGARTASGRAGRRFHPRTLGIYIPP